MIVELLNGKKVKTAIISELIKTLETVKDNYGDIPVFTTLDLKGDKYGVIQNDIVEIIMPVKINYDSRKFNDSILVFNKPKRESINYYDLFD